MATAETLGPAETIIATLLPYADHLVHNRPGVITPDPGSVIGVRWEPVTHKPEADGTATVFRLVKQGKKNTRVPIGKMNGDRQIHDVRTLVGTYQPAGIFSQVAVWIYRQIASVWQLDNEFAARWASYQFYQEHRDMKAVLAAFLLVQSRKGDPIMQDGEVLFCDEDFRDVGEAMVLLQEKGRDLNPKLLVRIGEILSLPEIAKINFELGFGKSEKHPFLGRWPRAIEKWLRYREENPRVLQGLVKAGFRTTVMELARRIGYKPTSQRFFEILRWKQKQADDGRRQIAIGLAVQEAESWVGLDERAICSAIERTKPNWKRIVGLLPPQIGVTRAIMSAAIEAGSMSDKDLIILVPTLEELGLHTVQHIKARIDAAIARADDMRAANVARNVRSKDLKEKLEAGADKAAQKAVAEVVRGLQVRVIVDISSSMKKALDAAIVIVCSLVQAFPLEQVRVSVFNTAGREITIKHRSTEGVRNAFHGITASGGTDYRAGVRALEKYKAAADEDLLMIFIGDEDAHPFADAIERSGLKPVAFGFLKTIPDGRPVGVPFGVDPVAVRATAQALKIPCFMIDERTFQGDPYAIPRTIRALIAAAPVGVATADRPRARVTLVEQILNTPLLTKPAWA